MRYSQYTGQKKTWPTASEAMAETQYKVPVYRGWPDRPYTVLGSLRFVDPNKYWDEGVMNMACDMARKKGGDAIVMRDFGTESGVSVTIGSAADKGLSFRNDVTALVIKWKSPQEIAAERATLEKLTGRLKHEHPDLAARKELVELATEYVRFQGIDLNSEEANQQLQQALTEVVNSPKEGPSTWLFRGTVRHGGLTTSWSDTVYGLATVSSTGENLTIFSSSDRSDLTFSGSLKGGRLAGQIGFSTGSTIISGKADGVYTDQKIALTGQGQTPDGTYQGSFSFSR